MMAATAAGPKGIVKASLFHYRIETSRCAVWFHVSGLRYGSEDRLDYLLHSSLRHKFDCDCWESYRPGAKPWCHCFSTASSALGATCALAFRPFLRSVRSGGTNRDQFGQGSPESLVFVGFKHYVSK